MWINKSELHMFKRWWRMVDDNGITNGTKAVLEECAIKTERMKADDMRIVLSFHCEDKVYAVIASCYVVVYNFGLTCKFPHIPALYALPN